MTLEANPNGVDERYFAGLLAAGVNRLSLGVQTTRLARPRPPARSPTPREPWAARSAGFVNPSLDLIFGWPGQTAADLDGLAAVLGGEVGGTVPSTSRCTG